MLTGAGFVSFAFVETAVPAPFEDGVSRGERLQAKTDF
jgi:hypothetical protein